MRISIHATIFGVDSRVNVILLTFNLIGVSRTKFQAEMQSSGLKKPLNHAIVPPGSSLSVFAEGAFF